MALESVTHISDLDAANPAFGDPISQGDNHLRNIKTALKTDLPNITGPVTATQAELNVLAGIASNGVVVRTGAGTGTTRTITAGTGISVSNGDGVSGNPTIAVTPGVGLGDVIGPAGATSGALAIYDGTTGKLLKAGGSASHAGSLDFSGSGLRLTGDFSSATIANRLAFQTNVLNDNTNLLVLPNGTGTVAGIRFENTSSATNSSVGILQTTATDFRLNSLVDGAGTQLPIALLINNVEAMRVDTSRNVLVTGSGGLGYGIGSGGTVTQATSKNATVTLNKPSGTITMNNATLNAGATVSFGFSNSSIGFQDIVDLQVVAGAATRGTYEVWADQSGFGAGSVAVFVKNISAGNLSEAVVLSFAVKKVATS